MKQSRQAVCPPSFHVYPNDQVPPEGMVLDPDPVPAPPLVPGALNAEDLAVRSAGTLAHRRNGRPFCQVIFWAKDEPQYDLRPLAEFLRGQMRLYDLLGHLDQEHTAVLLPENAARRAEQFAQNVRDAFECGISTIRHEICTYPLGQRNDPGQGGDEELPVESHEPDGTGFGQRSVPRPFSCP
ncbi:MAG: hypothetical protein R3F17_03775 [Planctomycetota bacterium]